MYLCSYILKKIFFYKLVISINNCICYRTLLIDFHKPNGSKNHPEMFRWLYDHFSNRVKQYIPPVYIQHEGKSIAI